MKNGKGKLAPSLLAICMVVSGCATSQTKEDTLIVRITTDSISAKLGDSTTTISVECNNQSSVAALLYGFESNVRTSAVYVERLCDVNRVGAGLAVLLFSEKGNQMQGSWSVHENNDLAYKPITDEIFKQLFEQGRLNYLAGTKVVPHGKTAVSTVTVPLYKFPLRRGVYYLHVVYYAGKGVAGGIVGQAQIDDDQARYNAKLFQGCATSNKIKLIVQ